MDVGGETTKFPTGKRANCPPHRRRRGPELVWLLARPVAAVWAAATMRLVQQLKNELRERRGWQAAELATGRSRHARQGEREEVLKL